MSEKIKLSCETKCTHCTKPADHEPLSTKVCRTIHCLVISVKDNIDREEQLNFQLKKVKAEIKKVRTDRNFAISRIKDLYKL